MHLWKYRKFTTLTFLSVLTFVLSACANIPAAAPADEMSSDAIELTILDVCAPITTPILDQLTERFKENHPDATINVECSQGDYAEGIYAKAAAGNLPDIMFSADLFTVPFVNNGVLIDMEELANSDDSFSFDDIYPNILGLGQVVGTPGTYMIPASWDSVQMYYNKDMFTAAGAPLPEDDWTWDDLIAACETIQANNEAVDCISIGGSGGWDWWAYFIPWIEGYGGQAVSDDFATSTFSTPEALAGIQAYVDMWNKHDVMIPLGADVPGDGQGCFISQNCATFFHIPGFMKTFREQITDFEWDVSITPAHPEKHATGMGTFGFGITTNSENPQAAWEYINVLASSEVQGQILRGYGGMPFLRSMADDPIFDELEAPPANIKAFIRGGNIGIFPPMGYPSKCGSLYAGLINQTIRTALEEAIREVKSVEQAFIDADAEIQACLDTAQ